MSSPRKNSRPESVDVFIARWRDRLGLAIAIGDTEGLAEFAREMYSVEAEITVTYRDNSPPQF